jgi:nitrate/nitrite transporter NarK
MISSLFRIFWGWISDIIGREKTYTLGALCACLGAWLGGFIFDQTGSYQAAFGLAIFFFILSVV